MPKSIEEIFIHTLRPFASNKNTGSIYEILVILDLLRKMGLSNEILASHTPMIENIIRHNDKKSDDIRSIFIKIKEKDVGYKLIVDGYLIKDIQNITQDDTAGTGDIRVISNTGKYITISICQGLMKKDGTIEKVLTNANAIRFGCTNEDIAHIRQISEKAVIAYKKYYTEHYGGDESHWPKRRRTPIAKDACSEVAKIVETRFASLTIKQKNRIFDDLLGIHDNSLPADYLAMIHKSYTPMYYKFEYVKMRDTWIPKIIAREIYLEFYVGDKKIGQTQVKFNNGIYHNGKTSSLYTSWNATFNLTYLFTMPKVQVISAPHTE